MSDSLVNDFFDEFIVVIDSLKELFLEGSVQDMRSTILSEDHEFQEISEVICFVCEPISDDLGNFSSRFDSVDGLPTEVLSEECLNDDFRGDFLHFLDDRNGCFPVSWEGRKEFLGYCLDHRDSAFKCIKMEGTWKKVSLSGPFFVFWNDETLSKGISSTERSFDFIVVLGVLQECLLVECIDDDDLNDEPIEDHDSLAVWLCSLDVLKDIEWVAMFSEGFSRDSEVSEEWVEHKDNFITKF